MKTTINRNSVVIANMSDQTAYLILDNINVGDIIEFDKNLSIEASIREELPDFGFEWNIDWWVDRYVLQFELDHVALQKFNKAYPIELCELLPNQIITKSFKFRKSKARYIDVPSKPCKCCGHIGNIRRYYLTFNIEKIWSESMSTLVQGNISVRKDFKTQKRQISLLNTSVQEFFQENGTFII